MGRPDGAGTPSRLAELPLAKRANRRRGCPGQIDLDHRARFVPARDAKSKESPRGCRRGRSRPAGSRSRSGQRVTDIGVMGKRTNVRQVIKRSVTSRRAPWLGGRHIRSCRRRSASLVGSGEDHPGACDADAGNGDSPHPACGRPLPEGRGEDDRDSAHTCAVGTADRPRPDGEKVGVRRAEKCDEPGDRCFKHRI